MESMSIERVFPVRPPLPLPAATSEQQLFAFLKSVRPENAPVQEMEQYCTQDWRRFVYTWGLVREMTGDCLELGANPYFTTFLLFEFTKLNMTLANYFGSQLPLRCTQNAEYSDRQSGQPTTRELAYFNFNIEAEPFPFPDGSFDVVLFCEIIEHLQMDPLAVLKEIKRVLKPGAVLVLTTPNVSRLENVARMISGANIYDPYSGYGPYGRHNREYNKHELHLLLTYAGFDVDAMFSADVHPNHAAEYCRLEDIEKLLAFRKHDLGQYLFVRCRNARPAGMKRPSWLYRSYSGDELE
jgi:SAM-dependent methyltransferase